MGTILPRREEAPDRPNRFPPQDRRGPQLGSVGGVRMTMSFTMRNPAWGPPAADLYAAALDMAAWADGQGFETVALSEHHNTSDGYLPSPTVMAGAIAARTTTVRIKLSVVLATLLHPIHLAEDLAVADLISNGRLHVTLGAGYRREEFLVFGVNWKRRPSLMVEVVETLRQAWQGEEFEFRGHPVRVLPKPARPGGPPLALGGSSEGSARRAAALDLAYEPTGERFYQVYLDELRRLGKPLPPPAGGGRPEPAGFRRGGTGPGGLLGPGRPARPAQRQRIRQLYGSEGPDTVQGGGVSGRLAAPG